MSEKSTGSFARDDQDNIKRYTRGVEQNGETYRAACWGSSEGQNLRFAILAQVGIEAGSSVLDVGSGSGDLLGWFQRQGLRVNYTGVDITPAMVNSAKLTYPEADFRLIVPGNETEQFGDQAYDYVVASGIFTFRDHEPSRFLSLMAESMYRACRKAVAFNCLSSWYPEESVFEYREDPIKALVCCRELTPHVALRHDYHRGDFTLYLKRPGVWPN